MARLIFWRHIIGMTYQNKIALITGGSSGIGLATAKALAGRGAHVWIVARDQERLAAALAQVNAARSNSSQRCEAIPADISDANQAAAAVAQVVASVGAPDLLINSAGIVYPGYFQALNPEIFRRHIEVNYLGTVYVTQAVAPGMTARGSGHIVNIASAAALLGVFGYTAYCGSKYAVRGFSDVLRAEMKPLGVNVSIVFPPDTDTPQFAGEMPLRPQETKLIFGSSVLTAEAVAATILQGVARQRYIITPGVEMMLLYRLLDALGPLQYPIMDRLVAGARRKTGAAADAQKKGSLP